MNLRKDKRKNQRLPGLQHGAQQPRLATEADVKTAKKTRKRMEGAAVDDEKHGDISSARTVDCPMSSTSFGKRTEPPALLICRDDALVDKSAEAPKPHLPPAEMGTLKTEGEKQPKIPASAWKALLYMMKSTGISLLPGPWMVR